MGDRDKTGSTIPGSDEQIEMFEKGMGEELSLPDFMRFVTETYNVTSIAKTLEIAAFMLCCDVIAQDIAKSTLRLRKYQDNGTSKVVLPSQHDMAFLLATEPNKHHTWVEYVEMMVLWQCLTSNSYSVVLRAKDGTPLELIPIQDGRITDKVIGRDIFYDVTASTQWEQMMLGAPSMTVSEADMIHVRGRMLDGHNGYSTMKIGAKTLQTSMSLETYRDKLFSEEGQMRGIFEREKEGTMSELAFKRLRMQFKEAMRKFKEGVEPIVTEDGVKFNQISAKPSDMELSKQFEAQINEVCRLLRVPPHKVFALGNVKYENLETLEKAYVGDTLKPIAKRFEQRYGKILLSRNDRKKYFFEHDREEMTLHDTKAVTERTIRAAERGILLIDEARAEFGKNPLPNGSGRVRMVPVNMVLVDEKNQIVVGSIATAADDTATDDTAPEETDGAEETTENAEKATRNTVIRLITK